MSKNDNALLLTNGNNVNSNLMQFIKENHNKINNVTAIGGNAIINDIIVKTIVLGDYIGNLKVSYINVGQADSILIQQGKHSMLIDAGNNTDGQLIKNYITKQNVSNLEFLIGTHPHADQLQLVLIF